MAGTDTEHLYLNPSRKPFIFHHGKLHDGQRWAATSENDLASNFIDNNGHPHVCQAFKNRLHRCKRANPLTYDVTFVCQKFVEDFTECYHGTKTRVKSRTARRLWAEFEFQKAQETLKDRIPRYKPLIS